MRAAAPTQQEQSQMMKQLQGLPAPSQLLQSVPEDDLLAQMVQSLETPQKDVCVRYEKWLNIVIF